MCILNLAGQGHQPLRGFGGRIRECTDGLLVVHEYEPSPTLKSWIPLWDDMGKRKRMKLKPSMEASPVTHNVRRKHVIAKGLLDADAFAVNDELRLAYKKRKAQMGLILPKRSQTH